MPFLTAIVLVRYPLDYADSQDMEIGHEAQSSGSRDWSNERAWCQRRPFHGPKEDR